ncbi:hypothetical protein SNEBB_009458 [Seison nebaliae]|nr:hypothetical protein SNEBB_009458 [Seison nebaliae]
MYPYLGEEHRFKKTLCSKSDCTSEFNQCSYNSIGSCHFIAIMAVIRSAPYFMYYVHLHHKHDNWNDITRMVDGIVSQPDVKLNVPPRLAGNYLAMELLKTTNANPLGYIDQDTLVQQNYLEYFTLLVLYPYMGRPELGIHILPIN